MPKRKTAKKAETEKIVLSLYVAGATPQSRSAISGIKKVLEKHLPSTYQLSVVDIYQNPEAAKIQQIVAVPTLVKEAPVPLRLFIGDLSQFGNVMEKISPAA